MILITGGRGAVATELRTLLHAHGSPLRVASKKPDRLDLPAGVDSARLDLSDPATFSTALAGIDSVFLYAEPANITQFVADAEAAGVRHIVVLSSATVADPGASDDPLANSHLAVENAVSNCSITSTILRPGSFSGNAGAWAWPIKSNQPMMLPFPNAYNDPIHEKDVAEVAFEIFLKPRYQGWTYTLTGPESLTFADQVDQLASTIGQTITVESVTPEVWKQAMSDYIPELYADALLKFWKSNDGKPVELTDTVEQLTGHPARTFAAWAQDHAADFTD